MSDKREFLQRDSPIISLHVGVYTDISYGRKIIRSTKKVKDRLIIGFYDLFHTRAITMDMISPIITVTGERGIEDGLF